MERRQDIESVITGVDGETFKEYVKFEVHITDEGDGEKKPGVDERKSAQGKVLQ